MGLGGGIIADMLRNSDLLRSMQGGPVFPPMNFPGATPGRPMPRSAPVYPVPAMRGRFNDLAFQMAGVPIGLPPLPGEPMMQIPKAPSGPSIMTNPLDIVRRFRSA